MTTKKKKLTTDQKLNILIKKVRAFQQTMGLDGWEIIPKIDELPSKVLASTKTNSNYKSATITFNVNRFEELIGDQVKLGRAITHEMFHILYSGVHRQHLDSVEVLIGALRSSITRRFTTEDEKVTVKLSRLFARDFMKDLR